MLKYGYLQFLFNNSFGFLQKRLFRTVLGLIQKQQVVETEQMFFIGWFLRLLLAGTYRSTI